MRRVRSGYFTEAVAVLGCIMLLGTANAPGIAKNDQRAAAVTDVGRKSDRLPMTSHSSEAPSELMLSAARRPPLGCDPLFSPIADPAQARLYRRCAV